MDENIRKILEAGVQAPSGSNSQPWKFRVRGNEIDILAFPEKDHPVLNFRNRGTWIAHGALLENISIAAPVFGYKAQVKMVPYDPSSNLIAVVSLEKSETRKNSLYDAIFLRSTNRKPYRNEPLTPEEKTSLLDSVRDIYEPEVKIIEDKNKLKLLGDAVAVNEIVMFENPILHKLMFEEIVWTKKAERRKGGGLYVKTLELKPPQLLAMKIFKFWPIMRLLNGLGLARAIAKDNGKNYARAALMGVVAVDDKDENFFNAGRIIERLWLKAAELGLSFHLITGVMFLNMRMMAGEDQKFSQEHIKLVKDAYRAIAEVFDVRQKIIAGLFRIGRSEPPTARSLKLPPAIL